MTLNTQRNGTFASFQLHFILDGVKKKNNVDTMKGIEVIFLHTIL